MGYGSSRSYGRRGYSRPQTVGRVAQANKRPGECRTCGVMVPAGAGQLWREESGAWSVVHVPQEWAGSPVSGQYVGGCPQETDRMNVEGKFGGEGGPRLEGERIRSAAAIYAAREGVPVGRQARSYAYTAGGARMSDHRGRCIDAPCCGCCD